MLAIDRSPFVDTSFKKEAAGHTKYFTKRTLFDLLEMHGFMVDTFTSDIVNFDNSEIIQYETRKTVPNARKVLDREGRERRRRSRLERDG